MSKKDQKEQDKIIKFLLDCKRDSNNEINISKNDLAEKKIEEEKFLQCINQISDSPNKLIDVHYRGAQKDLSIYVTIKLKQDIFSYFKNKKIQERKDRRENYGEFRAWITLAIAALGLLLSIASIYMQYAHE